MEDGTPNVFRCPGEYSPDMADLVISMWMVAKTQISTITVPPGWYGDEEPAPGSIQISESVFTAVAPTEWYETTNAQKYYAWYKVTHILYPGKQMTAIVESEYDKWMLSNGRYLSGNKGQGLKDGSKAAVKAFVNR